MRKSWLLLALFVVLLACKPVAQPVPTKTECNPPYHEYTPEDCCLDADNNGVCDRDENATIAQIVVNKTREATPDEVRERTIMSDTLIKFRKNVTSYSYDVGTMHYKVRGTLVRVIYDHMEPLGFKVNNSIPAFITDVYVDRTSHEAVGYCDARTESTIMGKSNSDRSVCRELIDIPLKLPYEKYSPYLPEDWLDRFSHALPSNIQDNDQYVKEPTGWKAVNPVLTFQEGKNEVILKLESKSGLPIRIQTNEPVETVRQEYTWFIQDNVKPEEVVYQPFRK